MTYILGDGGHARVLQGVFWAPLLGKDRPVPEDGDLIIGLGDVEKRRKLFNQYRDRVRGITAGDVIRGERSLTARGVQIMRGAIILPSAKLGENVLINTGAQIDHDCIIGDHCVISPGAILCGNVTLGEACFIGAGAIIVQGVTLPDETFVPAGTLVVESDDFRKPVRDVRNRVYHFEGEEAVIYGGAAGGSMAAG